MERLPPRCTSTCRVGRVEAALYMACLHFGLATPSMLELRPGLNADLGGWAAILNPSDGRRSSQ